MNVGFGNPTASCREYTLPRAHQDSVVKLWTKRHADIGPVLEVKAFCHLDVHGIEIPTPSTSGDNTNVWVVIFRGSNRYVDELLSKDPEYSPGSLAKADYGNMQDTDAEQPTVQSGRQCSLSDDHSPIRERKWEDITANEVRFKHELEYHISKFVGKLVRHENRFDRESRWCNSLEIDKSEAVICDPEVWRRYLH